MNAIKKGLHFKKKKSEFAQSCIYLMDMPTLEMSIVDKLIIALLSVDYFKALQFIPIHDLEIEHPDLYIDCARIYNYEVQDMFCDLCNSEAYKTKIPELVEKLIIQTN